MPELAEVEYYRSQWDAGLGKRVARVLLHPRTRIFRGVDAPGLAAAIARRRFSGSWARGKQMLFRFGKNVWIGVHLGMTGKLQVEALPFEPGKHDHFVLILPRVALVLSDARQFGRVRFETGSREPAWWRVIPPSPHEAGFTREAMIAFLNRHARLPIKATLLLQSGFSGVGNWMADEILWQAQIHPLRTTGQLTRAQTDRLWSTSRSVCRKALETIASDFDDPPAGWLFHQRWSRKGVCPRHKTTLKCATVGGRTTVWCAKCQPRTSG